MRLQDIAVILCFLFTALFFFLFIKQRGEQTLPGIFAGLAGTCLIAAITLLSTYQPWYDYRIPATPTPPPTITSWPPTPTTPTPTPTPTPAPTQPLAEKLSGWSDATEYTYVNFGHKSDEAPILWKVLVSNSKTALLLSDKILAASSYDTSNSTDWIGSSIRRYLNNEFILESFESNEIKVLDVAKDDDLVTIPTKNDLIQTAYGFTAGSTNISRIAYADSGSQNDGLFIQPTGTAAYYTRTRAAIAVMVIVRSDGSLGVGKANREDLGIRPMIRIKLDMLQYVSGDGTKENPYNISIR